MKQLDPGNKPVIAFFSSKFANLTSHGEVKGQNLTLILPRNHVLACHSDPANLMWTKIGTVKQLDHGNQPVTAFFQNLQI